VVVKVGSKSWHERLTAVHRCLRRVVPDLLGLGFTVVASTVLAIVSTGLRPGRLRVPLVGGDLYFTYGVVRGLLAHHWYLLNPDLGAPFKEDLRLFPLFDETHLLLIKIIGLGASDPILATNLYFLLGYPLAGAAAYLFLRLLGCRSPLSVPLAVSFAVLPWHLQRAPHLFLASYWVVPLGLCLVHLVSTGRWDSWADRLTLARRRLLIGGGVTAAITVGLGGIYYAFMLAFLIVIATTLRGRRAWFGPSAWLVGTLAGTTVVALGVTSWLAKQAATGVSYRSAFARVPAESEIYGGRLVSLLLPWPGSRVPFMSGIRHRYDSGTLLTSQVSSWHGLIAVAGTWLLLIAGITKLLRGRQTLRQPTANDRSMDWLAGHTLLVCLAFVTTGLGAVFAFLVTPEIRGWDRFSVFVALFGTAAIGVIMQRALDRVSLPRRRAVSVMAACALGLVVVVDQTRPLTPLSDDAMAASLTASKNAIAQVSVTVPRGCMVMQYPVFPFPGEPPRGSVSDYDQLIPYVATGAFRWSYGGVRGSLAGDWSGALDERSGSHLIAQVAASGFCVLEVLTGALSESQVRLASSLGGLVGNPIAVDAVNSRTYYDVRPARAKLLEAVGPVGIKRLREGALFPILARPDAGTVGPIEVGVYGPYRWATKRLATIAVSNPSGIARQVEVKSSLFAPPGTGKTTATVSIGGNRHKWTVGQAPTEISLKMHVSPRSSVNVRFETESAGLNAGARRIYLGVGEMTFAYYRGPLGALSGVSRGSERPHTSTSSMTRPSSSWRGTVRVRRLLVAIGDLVRGQ
jgi:hypothetical protein